MIKHGKEIITKSYYEGQETSEKRQLIESLFTNSDKLPFDVIQCISLITNKQTNKLELEICVDAKNRMRIVKKWNVS